MYLFHLFPGMVSAVDESVGTIVDTLKKRDMYDNAVIIFASDVSYYILDPIRWRVVIYGMIQ